MPKILFFDYSAFILMTAILFAMTYKRLAYGTNNKAFVMMILAVIFTTIFDIGMEQLIKPPVSENKLILAHIFSYGYLILRNGAFTIGIAIIAIEFSMNVSYFMQSIGGDLKGMLLAAVAALVPTALLIAETLMLGQTNFEKFASEELLAKIDR